MLQSRRRGTPKNGKKRSIVKRSPTEVAVAVEQAFAALANAEDSFDTIKEIRDKADALRKYAQDARAGLDLLNRVAELKLRAERRAGQLLLLMALRGGDRKSGRRSQVNLAELGLTKDQSARWQKEASVPDEEFARLVDAARRGKMELTAAALLRLATAWSKRAGEDEDDAPESLDDATEFSLREGDSPVALVDQLLDHCRALEDFLTPLGRGDDPEEFPSADKRHVRGVIREVVPMITRLREYLLAAEMPRYGAAVLPSQPGRNGDSE